MSLRTDIETAINRNSAENGSDTPDYILARFLEASLAAFDGRVAVLDVRRDDPLLPRRPSGPQPLVVACSVSASPDGCETKPKSNSAPPWLPSLTREATVGEWGGEKDARCVCHGKDRPHAPHLPCDMGCQPDWHHDDCAVYIKVTTPAPPGSSAEPDAGERGAS